jgi:methenyltetrahydrofolate cyclohydrolase
MQAGGAMTELAAAGAPALLDSRLGELLEEIGSEARVPAGGSSAALALAVAAALVAKVARLSRPEWPEAAGAAAQANALRRRAVMLAEADAAVYEEALLMLDAKGEAEPDAERRDAALGEALSRAADVPLLIASAAGDLGVLAADVAGGGRSDATADAAVAALLAEGCARSAHHLVEVNLATRPDDRRVADGARAVETARAAAKRAAAAAD